MVGKLIQKIGGDGVVIPEFLVLKHAEVGADCELLHESSAIYLALAFADSDQLLASFDVCALFFESFLPGLLHYLTY